MTVRYGQIKRRGYRRRCSREAGVDPMSELHRRVGGRLAHASLTAGALLLAACAGLPNGGSRPQIKPADSYQDTQSFTAAATDWPSDRWWDAYGDPQLSGLIDEAVK